MDSPDTQRYVERIAAPLVERAREDRSGVSYRFAALDGLAQVNAFAASGGFLYVYSGLVIAAEHEDELAGVSHTKLDISSAATRLTNSPLSLAYS